MNYSIKLSEICNKFRIMACISPQYVSYISSLLLNTLATFLLHYCYKERKSWGRGRRWGKDREGRPELSLLLLRPLKHLQVPPLVHQLVQNGVPLEASSRLHLVLHTTLLSLSLFCLHLALVLTKDGLSRIRLKHGQLGGFVLHLEWAAHKG